MLWSQSRTVEIICRRASLLYSFPLLLEAPKGVRQLQLVVSPEWMAAHKSPEPAVLQIIGLPDGQLSCKTQPLASWQPRSEPLFAEWPPHEPESPQLQ